MSGIKVRTGGAIEIRVAGIKVRFPEYPAWLLLRRQERQEAGVPRFPGHSSPDQRCCEGAALAARVQSGARRESLERFRGE